MPGRQASGQSRMAPTSLPKSFPFEPVQIGGSLRPHPSPIPLTLNREWPDCPSLRASNESRFIWSISSIWLVGLEIHPKELDRPERPANQTDQLVCVQRARRMVWPLRPRSFDPSYLSPPEGNLVDPRLRASNEHIPIVGVLRARRNGLATPFL
jgi:hypothetical protein